MHDSHTWRQRTGVKTLSPPPTLLTSINLNPSMDKKVWDDSDEIAYPKLFIQSQTSKVSNFIAHFIMDVITYPSWD